MRRLRFHLASLLICALCAALLLGFSLTPRIVSQGPGIISGSPGFGGPAIAFTGMPDSLLHSREIFVRQGWPCSVREERAIVRVSTPIPEDSNLEDYDTALSRWQWSKNVPIDWTCVALNGVALLCMTITVLFCVEALLQRRISKLETGQ